MASMAFSSSSAVGKSVAFTDLLAGIKNCFDVYFIFPVPMGSSSIGYAGASFLSLPSSMCGITFTRRIVTEPERSWRSDKTNRMYLYLHK